MPAPDDAFPDVWRLEENGEANVEVVAPLSPRARGLAGGLGPVVVVLELFFDAASWKSPSSPSWVAAGLPATPTASLNLL